MKNLALVLACFATIATGSLSFAQAADESSVNAFSTPMTQQDFDFLQSQSVDFRGPGGWNPGPGGNYDHSWHFVGCGRRSKCVEMANGAGFPYGYAGIDANACPHDNACYGRY